MKRDTRSIASGAFWGIIVGAAVAWCFVQICGCTNDTIDLTPDPCAGRMSVCLDAYQLATCDRGATIAIDDCNAWCIAEEGPGTLGSCAPDPWWPEAFAYCACMEPSP